MERFVAFVYTIMQFVILFSFSVSVCSASPLIMHREVLYQHNLLPDGIGGRDGGGCLSGVPNNHMEMVL